MNIVIDENIEFGKEAFEKFGNVISINGREIKNFDLQKVDALIVRSVTNVNEELLINTSVKFVGTATIGTDHIDLKYLKENKIYFADAKGCNADAVAEYIFAAIFKIANDKNLNLKDISIGIIGVGNIGSRIEKYSKALGLKVLLNDPPLKRKTNFKKYRQLDEVLSADILTLHVPLNLKGKDKTFHLFDEEILKELNPGKIILNASRGEVVDNNSLLNLINDKKFTVVLDVWENEPAINLELLKKVFLGTPHVAGYSLEGKVNGTKMIYDKFCNHFNLDEEWIPKLPEVNNPEIEVKSTLGSEEKFHYIIKQIYDIKNDDENMREMLKTDKTSAAKYFDRLRKEYSLRREANNYKIKADKLTTEEFDFLREMRFKVSEK